MKQYEISPESTNYLIGLKMNSLHTLYTISVDADRYIQHDTFFIFFINPDCMCKALQFANCGAENIKKHENVPYLYDLCAFFKKIRYSDDTDDANILNCLNGILDFLNYLPQPVVEKLYYKIICCAADYFTFSKNIKKFFMEPLKNHDFDKLYLPGDTNITQNSFIDSIYWSLGLILENAVFLDNNCITSTVPTPM